MVAGKRLWAVHPQLSPVFPAVEQEAVALRETHSFFQRVYRGRVGMMLNALLEEDRLSQEEIEELHEILRKADR